MRFNQVHFSSGPSAVESAGFCALALTACSWLLVLATMPLSLFVCIKARHDSRQHNAGPQKIISEPVLTSHIH
jgi:hypothetical protein